MKSFFHASRVYFVTVHPYPTDYCNFQQGSTLPAPWVPLYKHFFWNPENGVFNIWFFYDNLNYFDLLANVDAVRKHIKEH